MKPIVSAAMRNKLTRLGIDPVSLAVSDPPTSDQTDIVLCADLSPDPCFAPFAARVVGINGDSIDVRRVDNGEIEPIDGEYVWQILPFWDVYEAEGNER